MQGPVGWRVGVGHNGWEPGYCLHGIGLIPFQVDVPPNARSARNQWAHSLARMPSVPLADFLEGVMSVGIQPAGRCCRCLMNTLDLCGLGHDSKLQLELHLATP